MALIKCSECGKEVSENAEKCIHCGNPIYSSKSQEEIVCCPKCKSSNLYSGKRGFSGKKAVVGGILTGGIGVLAGTIGSNKIVYTCIKCGKKFKYSEALLKKPNGPYVSVTPPAYMKKPTNEDSTTFDSKPSEQDSQSCMVMIFVVILFIGIILVTTFN